MQKPDPSSIPLSPGVYLYRDGKGQVIYVGKARILRRRVLSYFRPEGLPAKTKAMLAHAQSIEFLTTTTEKEALLLEASLIKKYRPHYNIVLRDDKQYVLFRVNIKHPFPRLEVVRKARRDGARYFGPFTSSLAARETWKLLHRAFPLRRCSDRAMKNRVRPCLYHHMGQCPAPCMGLVTAEDYLEGVRRVYDLLQGKAAWKPPRKRWNSNRPLCCATRSALWKRPWNDRPRSCPAAATWTCWGCSRRNGAWPC
mgnify:CR=1 FL=1